VIGLAIESREYQNFIVDRISSLIESNHSVILELDCGMGKRVLIEETVKYIENEYGGLEGLAAIKSGSNSQYRKYLIENNRVILSLPIVFSNTIQKFPELSEGIEIVIINEVDQIVKRVSHRRILCVPWGKLIPNLDAKIVGMSGTLRDDHLVLDGDQLQLRNELKTLIEFIPDSKVITIEDFIDTDIKEHIQDTEVIIHPIEDTKTAKIINLLTENIEEIREIIIQDVNETSPKDSNKLRSNFYHNLPLLSVETELVEKLNRLLLLRKYVYSMPAQTYRNYLIRYGIEKSELDDLPEISGKELEVIKIAKKYQKTTILCSFLSTVESLSQRLKKENFEVFNVTGKIKNKIEILENFKITNKQSVLIMSPVGERDIDLPHTEMIIVFDLVNSPKTVYQKMKRGRGGKVTLLFYDETSEKTKVKNVVDKIAVRYPWSLIFFIKS
jgi:superfamily II DNA or RNA helicase